MTVRELLERIDSRELSEWMAHELVDGPLGGARGDVHAAVGAAATVNVNRSRRRPYPVSDFVPTWDTHREQQTPEQMLAIVVGLNRRMGGADLRDQRG